MLKEPAPHTAATCAKELPSYEAEGEVRMNSSFLPQKSHPISWSDSDVEKLLDFLNENFGDYKEKKSDFYNKASELFEGISPMQIKNKFKKLFLRYRTIMKEAGQAGPEYYNPWRYYEKIDRILRSHLGPDEFTQSVATEVGLGVPLSPTGAGTLPSNQQLGPTTNMAPQNSPIVPAQNGAGDDTREKVMAFFNAGRRSTDIFIWTHTETQRLLDCLEKHFDLYSRKKTDFYEKAAQLLPGVTSLQINNKLKKMVRRYQDIRKSPTPNNNGAATWVYFKQLDHIFRSNLDGGGSDSDSNSSNMDSNQLEDTCLPGISPVAKPPNSLDSNGNAGNMLLFNQFPLNNIVHRTDKLSINPTPPTPTTVDMETCHATPFHETELRGHSHKRARYEEHSNQGITSTTSLELEEILQHPEPEVRSQLLSIKEKELQMKEKSLEIDREVRLKQLEFDREIRLKELELDKEIRLKDLEYKYLQKRPL
ncbi:hypothetical protein K493DRAFT_307153 [Basidiobolus meristosporus CBS 931.73]|uniref:Myb/SANT-like DNA-binding domain-containing protein n=1 Tax=Basidiobolus meristosporus CBS 931.73 TaxID=1314790 RepID=A0A1Y1XJV6_9FUNG|nr:hypothetical protein K493DRAFT_307153 [Basidiobolus meristosporus CBS 931.73]|eukprot:ORX86030.1 hypothetical protein K493DRAFT_307153 [Basidiobolus meristosporus CBS 931.73]